MKFFKFMSVLLFCSTGFALPNASVQVLPILSDVATATAINQQSDIVGSYQDPESTERCAVAGGEYDCLTSFVFEYTTKSLRVLRPLAGDQELIPFDISDEGLVIAESVHHRFEKNSDGSETVFHTNTPVLCTPLSCRKIEIENQKDFVLRSFGNNNQIVGASYVVNPLTQSPEAKATLFTYDPVTLRVSVAQTYLSQISDFTHAWAMNDNGIFVGTGFNLAGGINMPFAVTEDRTDLMIVEQYQSPTDHMFLRDINNQNIIVGSKKNRPTYWTFNESDYSWTLGEYMSSDKSISGESSSINSFGNAVGTAEKYTSEKTELFGFFFNSNDNSFTALNDIIIDKNVKVLQAVDINDSNIIVTNAVVDDRKAVVVIEIEK
jgi:hypothetical protein